MEVSSWENHLFRWVIFHGYVKSPDGNGYDVGVLSNDDYYGILVVMIWLVLYSQIMEWWFWLHMLNLYANVVSTYLAIMMMFHKMIINAVQLLNPNGVISCLINHPGKKGPNSGTSICNWLTTSLKHSPVTLWRERSSCISHDMHSMICNSSLSFLDYSKIFQSVTIWLWLT